MSDGIGGGVSADGGRSAPAVAAGTNTTGKRGLQSTSRGPRRLTAAPSSPAEFGDVKVVRGNSEKFQGQTAGLTSRPYQELDATEVCSAGARQITYNVSAIHVDIPLNAFGDHDPKGRMYVLDSKIDDVREQERTQEVTPGLHNDPIQPLVIRANLGDCLRIKFKNRLDDEPASLHVHRGKVPPNESGSHVGTNTDSTVAPGESTTYTFQIEGNEQLDGVWYFHSHGNREQVAHGLFGALAVEPERSQWLDPHTGEPKRSGWAAMIDDPHDDAPAFREFVIMYHTVGDDTYRPRNVEGEKLPTVGPKTDAYRVGTKALNYRSEPHVRRLELLEDVPAARNPSDLDESLAYSSYTFGDPATPMPQAYLGDPTKLRVVNAGSEVEHVHHLHGGGIRWQFQPDVDDHGEYMFRNVSKAADEHSHAGTHSHAHAHSEPESDTQRLDSQGIGPGETYTNEIACGAGGCQRAAGDFLYHCHIADHYVAGMWAIWRVYDTKRSDLVELPNREGETPDPVTSTELLGTTLPSRETLTEANLDEWVESQLPPQGVPQGYDATVWNWRVENTSEGPLYLGEPNDTNSWPNFESANPGERPEIMFNPENGRIAYPLLRPHLGKRPPFAPGHGPAPYLGRNETLDEMAPNSDRAAVQADANRPKDQLCPAGSPIKRFNVVAVDTPVRFNEQTRTENAEVYVLAENKEAVLAGDRPTRPLVYRANVGDCVELTLTSELTDNDINHGFAKVNIHPHFVQFDPQASDGVITGFNYEQSIRPYSTESRTLVDDAQAGDRSVTVTTTDGLRPGVLIGVGLGTDDIELRRIENVSGDALTFERPLQRDHSEGRAVGVEFVRYRYYVDANFGTVFFHDHVNALRSFPRGLIGGLIVEPEGSTYHDPQTGDRIRSGPIADIHTDAPNEVAGAAGGPGESFREAVMLLSDDRQESLGVGGWINLRAEPLEARDSSHPLSSVTHGDPSTPVVRAYEGDPVVFRVLDGAPNADFSFRVTGHRFRLERYPNVTPQQAVHLEPSERFDLPLEGGAGPAGDYLYYVPQAQRFREGMWGIFRVHDALQSDLRPLPDRAAPPPGESFPTLDPKGTAPPPPTARVIPVRRALRCGNST